ncbi:enoyl-CoA hydratase/isomerase family protein [Burkholderia sp. Ac-20353]|uniref:enoyl-CoA hydratase/isomerase family protein n=1 Tax=Burkholderia sp. Ac-20353 TaxID=2703894 RepID=UPI00197BC097|nr:enoyl-CoA hydratase/isomerase family protein [Burkholderia sp. Ac-20353]MBN3789749.1 enoyl-CoA hydratase/isomerase family protein [Burkholderia sp. Ac-20353]
MKETSTDSAIVFGVEGRVATITLNTPRRGNALSIPLMHGFRAALQAAQHDPDIAVILLRANGRHFCTGADLGWAARVPGEEAQWHEGNEALVALLNELYRLTKPVVAQVHGTVLGGAVAVLCLCDDVIALGDAGWGLPELRLGLVPSAIVPVLRQIAAPHVIRRLLYDAAPWTSVDAHAFGIVTRLATGETLDALVQARIQAWLALPSAGFAATKGWMRELDADDFRNALERGHEYAASL